MRAEDACALADAINYQDHMISIAKTDSIRNQHQYTRMVLVSLAYEMSRGNEELLLLCGVNTNA